MNALKWHGGKSYLAKRIIAEMPPHTRFLDAFCGGLNVLLNKPCEGIAEWANDLNGDLTTFWKVLRDPAMFSELQRMLEATPLSEDTFELARTTQASSPVGSAYAFFVCNRMSRQGLHKDYCTPTKRTRRGMNENVSAWLGAIEGLAEVHARLRRVEIWNRPALDAIKILDGEDFLVYCDPPYLHETRNSKGEYGAFEMSVADHIKLVERLSDMDGKFILSGYRSSLYDSYAAFGGWRRIDIDIANHASGAGNKERKTECLWMNY